MNKCLRVYKVLHSTEALGFGRRFVIWTQGCMQNCPNCIAPDSHDINGGKSVNIDDLYEMILSKKGIDGLTITGGEPFLQCSVLVDLIKKLKEQRSELTYILYTGYKFDDLNVQKEALNLINMLDLLIDGNYNYSLDYNIPLIGSVNQQVYILTENGEKLAKYMQEQTSRNIEIFFDYSEVPFVVGIPPRGNY